MYIYFDFLKFLIVINGINGLHLVNVNTLKEISTSFKNFLVSANLSYEDELKENYLNILNIVYLNYWLIGLISFSFLFIAVQKEAVAVLILFYFLFLILIGKIKQNGNLDAASVTLVTGVWFLTTITCVLSGTVINAFSCWYISLAVVVGLLLGKKQVFLISFVTIIITLFILFLNIYGYFDQPFFPAPPIVSWVVFIIAFVQSVLPITLSIQNLSSISIDLEKNVKNRTKELETANVELEKANKELELFTYSLSHDLKNPLETIANLMELIKKDYSNEISKSLLDLIERAELNSKRMNSLTKSLLKYYVIKAETINKTSINMNEIIRNILENFSDDIKKCNVLLKLNAVPDCKGDSLLLTEVWLNLISNSLKFTSKIEKPEIEINFKIENEKIIYFIKDNGIGIGEEQLSSLFKPLKRLHNEEFYEGFGIGLAFVQSIILKHGGKIWAESTINKGTNMYFYLS